MPHSQPPKVLVVDDSRAVRVHVERILTDAGYLVITAEDGVEALACLEQHPALIVLDVNMPRLDGYGVCERLSELSQTRPRLPVIFLTSHESRALELLGREFGAYLHKPVSQTELLSAVKSQLETPS